MLFLGNRGENARIKLDLMAGTLLWGRGGGTCWKTGHLRDTGKLHFFSTKHLDFGTKIYKDDVTVTYHVGFDFTEDTS